MSGLILTGTCGYDYPEWRNVFYPQGLPREEFLMYYAARFSALELNYTFYRMPLEQQMRGIIKKSGGRLKFSIKATRTMTHEVTSDWETQASLFKEAVFPLLKDNLLSCVLFQFPQSFHYEKDNRIYLDKLLSSFSDIPSVVEFRHNNWLNDRVYEGLNRRNTGICLCDMPALKNLPGFVPIVTGTTAYIRYHGRNAQNWYGSAGSNGSERYRYLYSPKELTEAVPVIQSLATRSRLVHVFFNNHPGGAAAVNALSLQEMLD